ncbi:hypothetical protein AMELA_G00107080 [Ameiurus melas]|uniref:Protein kinase domain-containing protein n=1 Tax=Ameiurus melas TaxID=219545 RepID=A0A7J6AX15_AMEME|nr:hypothetical protein AMELA_G00107080 [Ameiurus melas]
MAKDYPTSSLDQIDFCSLKDPEGIFELLQMVGSGSYGQVFKGVHVRSGQLTAIKVINTMTANQEELKSEMNLLKTQSHHRNIATFYGAFIKKGTPVLGDQLWLVMEFCGGGSVSDLVHSRNEKCVSEDWTAYISGEILKGLAHLHKYKIIHRDIKGQNVLLTEAAESDVWSLGITAVEMLEGKPPLSGVHPFKAMLMVAQSKRLILNPGKWSENFQSFINSCLLYDHTQRPSATDLLKHAFISNIYTQIRGIRHEIVAHMNKQKEKKKQAGKGRGAEGMEKKSVQAGSPPRHRGLGPQMSNQEMEEGPRRKQPEGNCVVNFYINCPHDHKIHPPSPNLQSNQVAYPQICLSPQDEMTRKLRHKSPDSAKCNLRDYNSGNAHSAHDSRLASHSPCRRGQRDEDGQIDLSSSAPESSLRQMMRTRERRLYSASSGNLLDVPQSHLLPSVNYLKKKGNNNIDRRYSSENDMDSIWPDAPQKIKHGFVKLVKAVVSNMGLSPRGSPRHSPASSRSASPSNNSPTPSSPYGSPFSSPVE